METRFIYGLLFHFYYLFVHKMAQVNRPTRITQKSNRFLDSDTFTLHPTCISAFFDYYTHHSGGGYQAQTRPVQAYILMCWAGLGPKLYKEKCPGPGHKILARAEL